MNMMWCLTAMARQTTLVVTGAHPFPGPFLSVETYQEHQIKELYMM
jgi:hypothetical protein